MDLQTPNPFVDAHHDWKIDSLKPDSASTHTLDEVIVHPSTSTIVSAIDKDSEAQVTSTNGVASDQDDQSPLHRKTSLAPLRQDSINVIPLALRHPTSSGQTAFDYDDPQPITRRSTMQA